MRLDRGRTYGLMAERNLRSRSLWHEAQKYKADITESTVWNAANGRRDVSLEVAQAIASALDTTVDFLTAGSDQVQTNGLTPVAPELLPIVRRMNGLPPDQRARLAKAILDLLDITYIAFPLQMSHYSENMHTHRRAGKLIWHPKVIHGGRHNLLIVNMQNPLRSNSPC